MFSAQWTGWGSDTAWSPWSLSLALSYNSLWTIVKENNFHLCNKSWNPETSYQWLSYDIQPLLQKEILTNVDMCKIMCRERRRKSYKYEEILMKRDKLAFLHICLSAYFIFKTTRYILTKFAVRREFKELCNILTLVYTGPL